MLTYDDAFALGTRINNSDPNYNSVLETIDGFTLGYKPRKNTPGTGGFAPSVSDGLSELSFFGD